RVGGGDPAPVKGVIHNGSEEIGRGEDGKTVRDPNGCGIVATVETHENIGPGLAREAPNGVFEFAGWDFARTPAPVGEAGESDCA
ncbi:hypothetical protein SB748_34860, partial [Rhizobium sp. SIMBA_035]